MIILFYFSIIEILGIKDVISLISEVVYSREQVEDLHTLVGLRFELLKLCWTVSLLKRWVLCINLYLYYFYLLVYLKLDLGTFVTSCNIPLPCCFHLRHLRRLCNMPTCTHCLITWHSCWYHFLLVAVTLSLLACLLIRNIFHLYYRSLVHPKYKTRPF